MPQVNQQKVSFNGGVMSPALSVRLDLEKAASGCRVLQNFVPREAGGAFKRPGTEFLNRTKNAQEAVLRPFNYSVDTRFQLEFGAGYVRFWNNRARVHLPISTSSTWSGTTTEYVIGTPVFQSNVLYRAASTHTPSGGNQPPSVSWTTTNIKKWAASTAYVVGDLVLNVFTLYVCKTAHTSASTFSSTNWGQVNLNSFWNTATPYAVGDKLINVVAGNWRAFRCISAHTSAASTQPGVGASWTSRWENISTPPNHSTSSKVYVAGDAVKVSSTVYICNANHTSSTSNEPTDVGAPWSVLTGVTAWLGTSTARAVGDWTFYGNDIYRVKVAMTTTLYPTLVQVNGDEINVMTNSNPQNWTSSPTYDINAIVTNGTNNAFYLCVKEHVTASTTEPGTDGGKPYWQILQNLYKWVTGTNYTAGQYVRDGTTIYLVETDHTAGTLATDISAGRLVAADYPLELPTPYSSDDFKDVNSVTVNDQVWLLHPEYETLLLERFGDTAWKIGSVTWDWPPMRDENIEDDATLTASATTGTGVTLTSSTGQFTPEMVGGYFQIAHQREGANTKLVLNTATTAASPVLRLNGRWDIFIYGTTWTGDVSLQFSKDGSTNWLTQRTWDQPVANMRTIATFGTTSEEIYARLESNVTAPASGTINYAVLEAANSRVTGLVKVVGYLSPSQVLVDVVRDLWSTSPTTLWAEGAYSDHRGWPRAATVHEQRLILIGTRDEPDKVRASRFDGFFDFTELTSDDGTLAFVAASRETNALMWVESFGRILAMGSVAEEWSASSGNEGKILTPTNPPRIERETRSGSCDIPAVLLGDALMFFSNDRQEVYEFSYSFERNKHVKQRMTQLADHLFTGGIKQVAVARSPETVLYCVMNDGRLLTFTYDREQGVVAWAEHNTDGLFESVSVIYGGALNADEVWFVVKRTINSVDARYVEAFHQNTARMRFESGLNELCYCDCSILVTNVSPATVITGLGRLEGEAVVVVADGKVITGKTVSGGAITLSTAATTVRVGLAYTATLQGMPLELQLQDGSSMSRQQRTGEATIITLNSNGFEHNADPLDSSLQWYPNGDLSDIANINTRVTRTKITVASRHGYETDLTLRSAAPLPLNVLAIIYTNEYFG